MKDLFSIGELAKLQNISRQTLIFYDKIGLFCPAYIDPENDYRYYSINQLDNLDAICIMKKIGFSLNEIKENMKSFTSDRSILALRKQLTSINQQIEELELIKSRVEHRLNQIERSMDIFDRGDQVLIGDVDSQSILIQEVPAPYTLEMVSIITKECFVRAAKEHLPIFFQSGVIVPYPNILQGRYIEASHAFLSIEKSDHVDGVIELPQGRCVYTYHTGDYLSIGTSYQRILDYCQTHHLTIISDSYEFAMNDYLSTANENEYITKIMFYIQNEN
ncbi:MAG: MerR family transcriptional regulator [Erysipelotrichaceae bacterium]|nr:MerR family transcriptional regulator [Erysipelotrichaceae bacterium]